MEHCTKHGLLCLGLGDDCEGPAADHTKRLRAANLGKPEGVEVGQRWIHAGTPGLAHVVVEVDDEGWVVFDGTFGCVPATHLLASDRWSIQRETGL